MKIAALVLLLLTGAAYADNVTLYDRAPSIEELQRQLTGDNGPAKPHQKAKTRSIVFGGTSAPTAAQEDARAHKAQQQGTYQAPAAQSVRPIQAGDRAIAFPINFQLNSSDILPESVPFLDSIAGLLNKDPGMRLVVEGHTDASGSSTRNLALSRERAFSVMNFLIDHYRVDPLRLVPVGKGFSEPLGELTPDSPKNRRVQFRVIG